MTTYNSYEAAKIANPNSEIVTTGESWEFEPELKGKFERLVENGIEPHLLGDCAWVKCNPADHCMTVEQFLKAGHKFVEGDVILDDLFVCLISDHRKQDHWYQTNSANKPDIGDSFRYILRAAALKEEEQEPYWDGVTMVGGNEEKPKRVKVEHVKVEDSIFDLQSDYESGCLFGDSVGKTKIGSLAHLGACCDTDTVYRRIETPIEWWEDAAEYINQSTNDSCASSANGDTLHVRASMSRDKWCDFARTLLERGERYGR